MDDLACAIDECSVQFELVRFRSAAIIDGRMAANPEEFRLICSGSLQPLSGKEIARLPEGERSQQRSKLYTTTALKTVETSEARIADRVIYKGATYQVDKVEDWFDLGGYYRVELVRMGQ